MRIGRAAAAWDTLACTDDEWQRAVAALRERAATGAAGPALSIYPWDIVTEMQTRLAHPQAMLLVVPNGKVKLLNALPFAPADLRRDSLRDAWQAYRAAWRTTEVRDFVLRCRDEPALLRHANETWALHPALDRREAGEPSRLSRAPPQATPTARSPGFRGATGAWRTGEFLAGRLIWRKLPRIRSP